MDANELADGLLSRGYRVTKEEMDQLIDRMDLNQDGNIAFDEFSSALVDWQKVCPQPPHTAQTAETAFLPISAPH